jgi:hypothetical protein
MCMFAHVSDVYYLHHTALPTRCYNTAYLPLTTTPPQYSTTQTHISSPSSRSVRPLTPQAYCSSTALSPLRTRAVRSSMRELHRHTVIEFPQRSSRAATPHAFCFCSRFCFYFVLTIRNRDIGTAGTQLNGV